METLAASSQLSKTQALALLEQHCSVLRHRLAFDVSREHGAHVTQKWMLLLCNNVAASDLDTGLGYKLRAAIDIVNTLCACRGFHPRVNGQFWRNAASTLWLDRSSLDPTRVVFQPPRHYMMPFDKETFSCFTVHLQVYPYVLETPTLAELWRQIAWTNVDTKCPRAVLESRDNALRHLQLYVVRKLRTLRLAFKLPANVVFHREYQPNESPPATWSWELVHDALRVCSSEQLAGSTRNARTTQEISVEIQHDITNPTLFALHTNNLRQVRQLFSGNFAPIRCIRLDVVFQEDDAAESLQQELVWLGEMLLSLLVENQSLQTLRVEGHRRRHLVAATCSMLPIVSCLEELEIIDADQVEDTCWLSYALRHPMGCHDLAHLTVQFAIYEKRLPVSVWTSETPLWNVAQNSLDAAKVRYGHARVRVSSLRWLAMGTTVAHVLPLTADLFVDPTWVKRAWKPVGRGTKLEVVVTVASIDAVGVVVPGWGLCWIKAQAVTIETSTDTTPRRRQSTTKSLLLTSAPAGLPLLLVRHVVDGTSLVSLHIHDWGRDRDQKDELAALLECCPSLQCLSLENCNTEIIVPLVQAYESSACPCRIASRKLVFHGQCVEQSKCRRLDRLFDMLAKPKHPGARVLRHLSISLPSLHRMLVQRIVRVLTVNRTLESIFVVGRYDRWNPALLHTWTRERLSPFQDQVLCDASRSCIALLSVVREHSDSGGKLGAMDVLVVKTVMAFFGSTSVRTVRWVSGQVECFWSLYIC